MGMFRAAKNSGIAAMKGGSGLDIAKAGIKGMAPRAAGGMIDKVVTQDNLDRVKSGINDVIDKGRSATFQGAVPPPPIGGGQILKPSSTLVPPPPPPPSKG